MNVRNLYSNSVLSVAYLYEFLEQTKLLYSKKNKIFERMGDGELQEGVTNDLSQMKVRFYIL